MKKLLLLLLIYFPLRLQAQDSEFNPPRWKNLSRGYVYGMLHQDKFGGGITYDYGFNKYLAAGLGVEFTSFEDHLLIPTFIDLKARYPFGKFEPFINGQFGYNNYRVTYQYHYSDNNGNPATTNYQKTGKLFYGVGAGVSYLFGHIGVFASYTFRGYTYKYASFTANNSVVSFPDDKPTANLISAGIVF
ncbi:porin family protein [Chitinophaga sp. Cy-1792]|uniref:porin family protein n=1 Tax=Chitinophaga sp. Cy-1792 TaxID=2608339 RepID=UPI00141F9074|nr:porin family protein [Chitinophaga sp. Cy-1792]NIG52847.1 porin family protein [Chitinophaga sp. Cy-1792]